MPKSMLPPSFMFFFPRQRGEDPARKRLPLKSPCQKYFIYFCHTHRHILSAKVITGASSKYATVFSHAALFLVSLSRLFLFSCVGPPGKQQQTTGSQLGKPKSG